MENSNNLFDALFTLMQETNDISSNIDEAINILFDENDVKIQFIDKVNERFYNLLLIFLRDMPDGLWINQEHRINVNDLIREKLDEFTIKPTLDIKNKFYA